MRILVTGVSGFVGVHLVRELLGHGHRVWGADRIGSSNSGLEGGAAVPTDLRHRSDVRRLLAETRPDAIIHLAAQSSPASSWQEPGETIESNTAGTANLIAETSAQKHAPLFLFASSSDVYGTSQGQPVEFTESSPLNPRTPYAVSKMAAEQVATLLAARARVRLIIARPFSHTGPGQTDRFVVPAFARQVASIELGDASELLHGDLDPCRDFTDVRDVVRAYRLLVESPQTSGVYNICSGKAISIRSILEALCVIADRPIACRPDPSRTRGEGANPMHGNAARLKEATGWSPEIPLIQTIAAVLAEQRLLLAAMREGSCAERT